MIFNLYKKNPYIYGELSNKHAKNLEHVALIMSILRN